ncbi:DUF29 domain-containing protein [Nostoc sp. CALU 1950]|uniref:DUF29 domain-containing protein n=1 Tax=Nostoc sp. CALU 1950 TaxID=3104321 RepID=UPI003EB6C541
MTIRYLVYMVTDLHKQGLLLLRQALDNSTANFRPGQWEAIESLLIKLLQHLLKLKCWDKERERNQGHWKGEIRTFRREIKKALKDSPSLKPYILEIFDECYQDARTEASDRSQLAIDIFPFIPIGSLEQILDENWFPEYNHNHHGKAD